MKQQLGGGRCDLKGLAVTAPMKETVHVIPAHLGNAGQRSQRHGRAVEQRRYRRHQIWRLHVGVNLGVERVLDGGDSQRRERGRGLELIDALSELMAFRLGHEMVDSGMRETEAVQAFDQAEGAHVILHLLFLRRGRGILLCWLRGKGELKSNYARTRGITNNQMTTNK